MKTILVLAALGAASVPVRAADPITNSLGMKLVPIAAGEFTMGSDKKPANWDEKPLHRVTLGGAFHIAETEVTAEQYRQFKPGAPLTEAYAPFAAGVSWNDAVAFCQWLSAKEGRNYRLPTEAEWEYVCRAGRDDGAKWETTAGAANPWGVKNLLAGPVEWCVDAYGEYEFGAQRDPVGSVFNFMNVVRGGYLDEAEKYKPADYLRPSNRAGASPNFGPYADGAPNPQGYGLHRIGFRVVLAPPVGQRPTKPLLASYAQRGVIAANADAKLGPDPKQPYFRRRRMLPIPPEDTKQPEIDRTGLHPSFRDHNHSPGFAVLPNGDALLVIYTSYNEYEPEVSLMAARLRFGAEQWDMPSPFLDTPGANDHAPLLWQGKDKLWLFWGNPYVEGNFPFNYLTSTDNGATWSGVNYPHVTGPLGKSLERPQPINTVITDNKGAMYLAVDAAGGGPLKSQSMLWATADGGATWHDTLGRTFGRHTTFVLKNDGSILAMGGKNSQIDDFMPRGISKDGGATYEMSKTSFSQMNSGQRPCIIRLASGRLFMCGDYQPSKNGKKPASIKEDGCYVALSDDDGETWRVKRLPGAFSQHRGWPSVGYSVARQAPNGNVHVITTLNHPALHFELNEAWILSDATLADDDAAMDRGTDTKISGVKEHRENYADGQARVVWSSGVADDGRVLLHGHETWFYADGKKQREADYVLGRKRGAEVSWLPNGTKEFEWQHRDDGTSVWTTYWHDGSKRSESTWKNHELVPGTDKFFAHAP